MKLSQIRSVRRDLAKSTKYEDIEEIIRLFE
jgi:hypothetical protein